MRGGIEGDGHKKQGVALQMLSQKKKAWRYLPRKKHIPCFC